MGGRPGSFKTALLWNLALNAAEEGQRVMFATLEMTPGEMALLAFAKFSGLPRARIEQNFDPRFARPFDDEERARWDAAVLKFQGLSTVLRIHGADEAGRDVDDVLRSACRARFDAVMIDHLGMVGRDTRRNELEALGHAVHRFRGLSRGEVGRNYRPWVVATSQLNREIDKGEDERPPRLADFRGSSRIEHDADVAIGLQKRKRDPGDESPLYALDGFVLKNRHGPAPAVILFDANGPTGLITERDLPERKEAA